MNTQKSFLWTCKIKKSSLLLFLSVSWGWKMQKRWTAIRTYRLQISRKGSIHPKKNLFFPLNTGHAGSIGFMQLFIFYHAGTSLYVNTVWVNKLPLRYLQIYIYIYIKNNLRKLSLQKRQCEHSVRNTLHQRNTTLTVSSAFCAVCIPKVDVW